MTCQREMFNIKYVIDYRSLDVNGLIGYIGGYIGFFVGYSILEVPDTLTMMTRNFKRLYSQSMNYIGY